ncbi:MAG: efflux RND transporter periplasmic adaptor subunit [Planctomycetota bacterium]|jgi:multidrug efflux pump subunit AcrA (membrane-fusion protein)
MKTSVAIGLLLTTSLLLAQDAPKTVAAEKGTLRVSVRIDGVFHPADPAELKLDCETFQGPFKLEMIAPHGSWVNKGDIVARIDRKAYTDALERETMAMERAEMDMRHHLEKLRMDEEKDAEKLARARRESHRATKRLQGFRELEKAFTEESERLTAQSREHGMERAKDELTQLEKMYSEDELVDATEEIVLKRQRRSYARALANYDLWQRRRKYNKEWYEVWREEDYVTAAESKEAALRRAVRDAELSKERVAADLKKRKHSLTKKREAFAKLKADGEKLVFRAPYRGLFLHGTERRYAELKKDGQLRNKSVFGEVMKPGALAVVGAVKETDILRVKPGLACEVKPAAAEDQTLVGSLRVDYLPGKMKSFEATIAMAEVPPGVRPGMSGKVEIIIKEVRDAVLVPKSAVTGAAGAKKVRVVANGDPVARPVVTGETDGKKIVIREGLQPGEKVVIPTPNAKAKK